MTSKIVTALLAMLLSLACGNAQAQANRDEATIRKIESELAAALEKSDSDTLARILADDYIEINPQGGLKKKADVVGFARSNGGGPRGVVMGPDKKVDEFSIRLHGDNALVVGRTTIRYQFMENQTVSPQKSQFQNPVAIDQERFMRVYAKVGGRWQLIAWQTTSIAKR
jgi:ketosteroid isomerase-like protein